MDPAGVERMAHEGIEGGQLGVGEAETVRHLASALPDGVGVVAVHPGTVAGIGAHGKKGDCGEQRCQGLGVFLAGVLQSQVEDAHHLAQFGHLMHGSGPAQRGRHRRRRQASDGGAVHCPGLHVEIHCGHQRRPGRIAVVLRHMGQAELLVDPPGLAGSGSDG